METSSPLAAKRILIIRYRFLGDTILAVPFLRNLRNAYPESQIDMMVGPQSGEVLKGCPYVDNFIVYDTTRFHKYDKGKGKPKKFFHYLKSIRSTNYDLVFVLKRSLTAHLLAYFSGAKSRVGYKMPGREFFLTHKVPFDENIHEIESCLNVARAAGVPISDNKMEAWISAEENTSIKNKVPQLKNNDGKILIHAAAAHPDKIYPNSKWIELLKILKSKFNLTPYFTGAPRDRELYEELARLSDVKSVNMAGELNIRESMALYSHMDLALCVDSGPAHLASAVGVPTYTLFGPTDPTRWSPQGTNSRAIFDSSLECRPCFYNKTCENRECLTNLDPDVIIEIMTEQLKIVVDRA